MSSREAISLLIKAGYTLRLGKGSHIVLFNPTTLKTIVISNGKSQLSPGMQGKVRSALNKSTVKGKHEAGS